MPELNHLRSNFRLRNPILVRSLYVVPPQIEAAFKRRTTMAGRPGITVVDVARACVSLNRQRRRLGPSNVRLELGRGSMTTISRHLRRLAFRKFCEENLRKPSGVQRSK